MKKLFLGSSFSDVAQLFPEWIEEDIKGKTVTFIPTAGVPEEITFFIDNDRKAFEQLGILVDELEISTAFREEIKAKLLKNDYIFLSGGNTFFLLQELKRTRTDMLIKELIFAWKPYIWTSAGSMVLAPNIEYWALMDVPEKAPNLKDFSALNVVNFYLVPHYGEFPFVDATNEIVNRYTELPLLPLNNKQVVCINGETQKIKTTV